MLSHDEHRHLRAIEQWFETDDPALAKMLRSHEPPPRPYERRSVRLAVDMLGGVLFVVGALTATGAFILFGAILIAAGVSLHLSKRSEDD